ncbi:MAG: IS110 family transposase, partial [Sphingobacteriales bacterium]
TVRSDERLYQLFQWLTSVEGVGKVLALEMILATNEFISFTSPKKFACHCGVAPFKYVSGTSLNSKARVSKKANARMKRLLHMAAIASVRIKQGELKAYYERRVKEGKNKMSVLNVIRNKIIRRAFACVREQRAYQKSLH